MKKQKKGNDFSWGKVAYKMECQVCGEKYRPDELEVKRGHDECCCPSEGYEYMELKAGNCKGCGTNLKTEKSEEWTLGPRTNKNLVKVKETAETNIDKVEKSLEVIRGRKIRIYRNEKGEYNAGGKRKRYIVRLAVTEDSEKLASLYKESFPNYPYKILHTKEYHEKNADSKECVRLIVENENKEIVAAGALGIIAPCLLGELKQAVVHPKHRGNSLSGLLVKYRTKIAEDIGLEMVDTHARTREPGIQKTLLNCGYEPVDIVEGIYIVYHEGGAVRENMIYMVKYLNGGEKRKDKKDNIIPEIKKKLIKKCAEYLYNQPPRPDAWKWGDDWMAGPSI